jgi:DNA-binding PucR family transcriptional regulator
MVCAAAGDHIPDARLRLACSGPHRGRAGVRHGFELTRRTLEAAERLNWRGVVRPDDVLLPALLVSAPDVARELVDLVQPVVCDRRSARDLAGTLRTYLETGLSVQATSRSSGLHPSAVRARLGRVERLLGGRVADRATALHLAVLASDLGFAGASVVATDDDGVDPS